MLRLSNVAGFDWDDGNRDKNWLKHQVANTEAEEAFFDPLKLVVADAFTPVMAKLGISFSDR